MLVFLSPANLLRWSNVQLHGDDTVCLAQHVLIKLVLAAACMARVSDS